MLPWFQNVPPYPSEVGYLWEVLPSITLSSAAFPQCGDFDTHPCSLLFTAWCIAELMSTVSLHSSWVMAVFFRAAICDAATRSIWAHELFWNTCSFNLNKYLQQRKIEISMCSPSWMLDCFPNYFTTETVWYASTACSHFSSIYWCSVAGHLLTGFLSILFCECCSDVLLTSHFLELLSY